MLEIWVIHRVVVAKLHHCARAQQVAPRIAHVRECVGLPTQHQRRERGQTQYRMTAFVDAHEPRVLGADDTV